MGSTLATAIGAMPAYAPPQPPSAKDLVVASETALMRLPESQDVAAARADPAPVLSPSQVRCSLDCPARWWFKYQLQIPERESSSLALGLAVHRALEVNCGKSWKPWRTSRLPV